MLNWLGWLPENASTYGGDIDSVIAVIWYNTVIWLALTFGAIGICLVRYRRRPGRTAAYIRGERLREAAWILVPLAVVLVIDLWLDFWAAPVWARVKLAQPPPALTVQVTGKQFNWEIVYPGPDGRFGTADDKLFLDEFHVPVDRPIRVVLRSKDVIHSFFLPNFRLKQDVVPGREITGWFQATKAGKYELPCAELCGFGHSGMKAYLYVDSPEEYERWVKEQWS